MDALKDPAWIALIISSIAAVGGVAASLYTRSAAGAAHRSAQAAEDTARISKADALVCRAKLELSVGHDNDALTKQGRRHGIITNTGPEVAYNVRYLRDESDVHVEEFLARDLDQGDQIKFDLDSPNPYLYTRPPSEGDADRALSHYLVVEFERPPGLGGATIQKPFRYEGVFDGYADENTPDRRT